MARKRLGQVDTFEQQAQRIIEEGRFSYTDGGRGEIAAFYAAKANEAYEKYERADGPEVQRYLNEYNRLATLAQAFVPSRDDSLAYAIRNYLENAANQNPESVRAQMVKFWQSFASAGASFEPYANQLYATLYICSAFAVKPDPLGRFILMDIRSRRGRAYGLVSGARNVVVGSVTYEPGDTKSGSNGEYGRAHGSPGARVRKAGIGATMYMGCALIAQVVDQLAGTFSPSPGNPEHNRTPSADNVWRGLVSNGSAYREGDEYEEETTTHECRTVRGETTEVEDDNGYMVEATIKRPRQICDDVDVTYTRSDESDFLDGTTLTQETEFVAFGGREYNEGANGPLGNLLTSRMPSTWETADDALTDPRDEPMEFYHVDGKYYDSDKFPVVSEVTAEMMVRALHGDNPRVVMTIAETIKRSVAGQKGEDWVVAYLTRSDIAQVMGENPRYLELIGQQRLPGLGGLSADARREVMRASQRLGQIQYTSGNPLNLPKASKKLVDVIRRFGVDE